MSVDWVRKCLSTVWCVILDPTATQTPDPLEMPKDVPSQIFQAKTATSGESAIGCRRTPLSHQQKMTRGVLPTSDFLWTQENDRGNAMKTESALAVYSYGARLSHHCICISNVSQNDRAKSKLEYCGAVWPQKRLTMGHVTTAAGATTTNVGPTPSLQSPPRPIFHFSYWPKLLSFGSVISVRISGVTAW